VWVSVPVLLFVGCAEHERSSSVSYSPALSSSVTPTSDRSEARVYASPAVPFDASQPPPGAANQDWALAQQIRSLLMSESKLGEAGMAAVVNNGVVTLKGGVRNKEEREKLRDEISRLPGVKRVDDQMESNNPQGIGAGESKSY